MKRVSSMRMRGGGGSIKAREGSVRGRGAKAE